MSKHLSIKFTFPKNSLITSLQPVSVYQWFLHTHLILPSLRFFRKYVSIVFEFIPQIIFLVALFGYLCIMVFYKWVNFGCGEAFDSHHQANCAPSVLIYFINMVLLKKDDVSVEGKGTLEKELRRKRTE